MISRSPHLVIDGSVMTASSIGADHVVFAVHEGSGAGVDLRAALAERGDGMPATTVLDIPPRFIASEANSLVTFQNIGDARPLGRIPPILDSGFRDRPTPVDNAETRPVGPIEVRLGRRWSPGRSRFRRQHRGIGAPGNSGIWKWVNGCQWRPLPRRRPR